jgi:prolipoprotein diacylglyceryl transferase
VTLASIPSPSTAVWHLDLGFVTIPLRAYALCIIAGIVVACIVTDRRMRSRGAPPWAVLDIAMWAVPFGIIGARIYHVISSPDDYFGHGMDGFAKAFKIWEGGLGIWGAVAGGAVGAWLGCRQLGIKFSFVADCIAVGLPLAQAVGRLGNWFNNELYGGQTSAPWGLQVHQMSTGGPGEPPVGQALVGPDGEPLLREGLYHPTFLYELVWNLGVAALVYWLDKRFKFGRGRAFAVYVMAYTTGRVWIEAMRTDPAEVILGQRINVWVSILVFLGALAYFLLKKGPQEFLIPLTEGKGFQVVTEEQFHAFQAEGTRPEVAETAGAAESAAPQPPSADANGAESSAEAEAEIADEAPAAASANGSEAADNADVDDTKVPADKQKDSSTASKD